MFQGKNGWIYRRQSKRKEKEKKSANSSSSIAAAFTFEDRQGLRVVNEKDKWCN